MKNFNMMKKLLALTLGAAMLLAVMTGCGKSCREIILQIGIGIRVRSICARILFSHRISNRLAGVGIVICDERFQPLSKSF